MTPLLIEGKGAQQRTAAAGDPRQQQDAQDHPWKRGRSGYPAILPGRFQALGIIVWPAFRVISVLNAHVAFLLRC